MNHRIHCFAVRSALVSVAMCAVFLGTMAGALVPAPWVRAQAVVVGQEKCQKCHVTESKAWLASPHATATFADLSSDKAPAFAKAMGVTGDLKSSLCAQCHSTDPAGSSVNGVSCESCHNPAGPEASGWFKIHSDYGLPFDGTGSPIAMRDQEPEAHRESRIAQCEKLGMVRSTNIYGVAKNCLGCHTVPNEKLVNAGHPTSKRFELVRWSQGVVRHNFALDQSTNAEAPSLWLNPIPARPNRSPENRKKLMFVTGQLADLEVSLRARANASDGDYGKAVNARIEDAKGELEDLSHIPEVQSALAAVGDIDRGRLRQFTGEDAQFFANAADGVLKAASSFVENHPDGDDLGKVKPPRRSEGTPFQP
jgi:Cytochrome c554 and c-prime